MKKRLGLLLALASIAMFISGCGGGGGSSATGGATGTPVNLYVTDNLNTNYDAVWVKIHEVEVEGATGSTTVFRSDAGVEVNLRALSDGSPLYKFLGGVSVPTGTYTTAKITMAKSLVVFTTGATTGQTVQFAPAFDQASGRSRVNLAFNPALVVAASSNLVVDFDLSQWTLAGGLVTPVVKLGSGQGIDDVNRHVSEDYKGTVSALAGSSPNFSFTLTLLSGATMKVATSNASVIFSNSVSPILANGQVVEASGQYDPTAKILNARFVKIEDGTSTGGESKAKGTASDINEAAGTFRVTPGEVRGFLPTASTVIVSTSTNTRFLDHSGVAITKAEFYAALGTSGAGAEAEGSYDGGSNTLTAAKAKLEIEGSNLESEAKGAASAINPAAGTLTIAVAEWQGFSFTSGAALPVTTSPVTEFRNVDGQTVTSAAFFAQVTAGATVKVHGSFLGSSMFARRMEVKSGGGGTGNDPHEAKGYVSNANVISRTFVIQLVSWFGFNATFGSSLPVLMSESATYRDDNGDSMTKEQFFAALTNGRVAEVEGSLSGGTLNGVKAKLDD